IVAVPICLRFDRQPACRAFSRAWAKTGKRMAANIAIIAITTSSSIRVNAGFRARRIDDLLSSVAGWESPGARRSTTDHSTGMFGLLPEIPAARGAAAVPSRFSESPATLPARLFQPQFLVDGRMHHRLSHSVRPAQLDPIHHGDGSEPHVHPRIAGGEIAAAGGRPAIPAPAAGSDDDLGSF